MNVREPTLAMFAAHRADVIFPVQHIRMAAAIMPAVVNWLPPRPVLAGLDRALKDYPSDPKLNFWRVVHLARGGNIEAARKALAEWRGKSAYLSQMDQSEKLIDHMETMEKEDK